jgi:hypothetical protein
MKKNLIALFFTGIIFLQIIPIASCIQLGLSFDNDFSNENEITLSISLEELVDNNLEVAKLLTDKVNLNFKALMHFETACMVHFNQNHIKPNKGFVSIIIAPPNSNA